MVHSGIGGCYTNGLPEYTASLFNAPDNTARAKKVLDARYSEISEFLHEQLRGLFKYLVRFDTKNRTLTINNVLPCKYLANAWTLGSVGTTS